ncbi:3'-5' exoribonuclease domain-containing protein [Escherichia coli]|nr:3'-5' exoribonuclease [Escherichia coli]
MSKVFICAAIPDEQAIKEEGAVAVATAIEAGDERRARAKFHWQFLEHYPAAQDCAYKFLVCEDKPGIPRPALDSWDAEYMQENRWDEASASFVPVSASMRKQPDALRYDRQTIFGLVRERPIDIHKDPVALNKYITEYLTTKGVFEDEGTNQSATDTLSSPVPETDAVETAIPDNEKTECKVEVEPSVEREGPFYFLFTDKDGEKYGRANKLSGLDKALSAGATEITKEEYFARKNGTYSGSQQNTGASDTTAQPGSVKVTADEVNKIMQAANISQPDADELLAVSRGEFVEGISDPNDPKWVKGIQTRDSVNQNQQETEQNDQKAEQNSPNTQQNEPETKQPEPVVQQEPEKICTACGHSGGGNCPDCGAVMGDATYQEIFDGENQPEVQENDPEEMEGTAHQHKENTGGNQHHASDSETGEASDPLIKANGHHNLTSTSRAGIHLMIDLETMGKNPDAPIISIGAIFFDPQTGDMGPEFSKTIDLETAGGVIDRDTIKWWLKQSREAQSAIMTDEIPLDDALLQLREFIDENSGEFFVHVWGNGANFDNTILRRSYERQGIPCPWRYYNDRDVRTIVELGKAIDFDARTAIPFEGERHNALDDARYQAKYVSAIWQKLIPSQADS